MADMAKLMEGLSESQRALLLQRLNKAARNRAEQPEAARIPTRPRDSNLFPLSFSQQRLWFFDQLVPGNSFFNMPAAVRFGGPLDVAALEKSLNEIVRRHEVLRTNFVAVDGEPRQATLPALRLQVERLDLRHLEEEEAREAEVRRLATEEAQRPFDLTAAPLLRATVVRLGEEDHALLLTMHHIVSDGWSMGVLLRELGALYEAYSAGRPSPLAELPIQYADYAAWQRESLRGDVLDRQLSYWKRQLDGITPLQLPTARPRPAVQTFRGRREFVAFEKGVTDALKALARGEGTSLYVTLLAVFKALLQRYSGQHDIVIGSLIAGRNRSEVEPLIGFFVNALVLRTDLSGNPTFRELLGRVRQTALGAYAHQDLPLEKIVEELQPERDLSRHPLYQVHFVMQNAADAGGGAEVPGLSMRPQAFDSEMIRVDLEFHLSEAGETLRGVMVYNTDLFDAEAVRRLLSHYQVMVAAVVSDPDRRLEELPMLTEAERGQLLVEWNSTSAPYPADACLHQLFERHAAGRPAAPALIERGVTLDYRELDGRANRLAGRLRRAGVGPETRVGICLPRSSEMVVAVLAVLKAGGAFVPLDSTYPEERLTFMMRDARIHLLLTDGQFRSEEAHNLLTEDWPGDDDPESPADVSGGVTPDNLAYVIYTSGSTGRPKGVALSHRGVVNNLADLNRGIAGYEARTLNLSSMSFDMCVYEVLGTLAAGGTILLPEPSAARDPAHWAELIVRHRATVWNSAPALLEMLVNYVEDKPELWPRSLRIAFLGGDWIPVTLPGRLKAMAPDLRFVALGGATEASIHSIVYVVEATDPAWKSIPYGMPMSNQHAYVLDAAGRLVPVGVPGELHLGGVGLARGYFGAPGLTASKFIPNPYSRTPGGRMYRTGDLARYMPDGNIELLGRIDHQVKISGYRIELGEILAALRQHPGVDDCVAVVREDGAGTQRLVAYFVPASRPAPGAKQLREFLKQRLPAHMVPAVFCELDALPLSPNGKVSRDALPRPDFTRAAEGSFVAPRTPSEQALAEVWTEVLGLDRVGIHDNFFELGGDSILAIQIIHRANQKDLRLSPRQVFQHPTVAELAAAVGVAPAAAAEQGAVTGEAPLTPSQHWFFEQQFAEPHYWNQAIVLRPERAVDPSLLAEAVKQVFAHHDALRLRFEREGSGWRQFHAPADEAECFLLVDLEGLGQEERRPSLQRKAEELQASLRLAEGPLARVAYFRRGDPESDRLLIVIHHLVVDTVSWGILLKDLQAAYEQLGGGRRAARLPAKTTSYKSWAERLAAHAQGEEVRRDLDYWTSAARRRARPLPADFPAGVNDEASASSVRGQLSVEQTDALLHRLPRTFSVQINDVLLTALGHAFGRACGVAPLLVDLGGHGREDLFDDVDLSRTVGWFSVSHPVLIEAGELDDAGGALAAVSESLRGVPRRGISYGMLRYLCADADVRREMRSTPEAEVGFNYVGQVSHALPQSSLFVPAQEGGVPVHSPRSRRRHLLEVFCEVRGGQFSTNWVYSRNVHAAATVERLVDEFLDALRRLVAPAP
jgi:amino acid adenylation domain-containing protein/non-ribosomal peptide synthase protein (TIGR01720 family)